MGFYLNCNERLSWNEDENENEQPKLVRRLSGEFALIRAWIATNRLSNEWYHWETAPRTRSWIESGLPIEGKSVDYWPMAVADEPSALPQQSFVEMQ